MIEIIDCTRTRKYKAGYWVYTGTWQLDMTDQKTPMRWAVTPAGDYIGSPKDAFFLCRTKGIKPEIRMPDSGGCSIGFCEREQKWYGWSHRAIHGFGVGDSVKEGDCCAISGWTDEYLAEHPEEDSSLPIGFVAKTLDDARTMACAFSESVS